MHKRLVSFLKFLFSSKTVFFLFFNTVFILLIVLCFLVVFLKISYEILGNNVLILDQQALKWALSLRSTYLTEIMLTMTFIGSGLFLLATSIFSAFYLFFKNRKESFFFLVFIYSGVLLNLVLKIFYHRPRPEDLPLVNESTFSFPSAHAMNSFVFFAALNYYIFNKFQEKEIRIVIAALSLILVLIIGFSRLYLGAHYLSDIVAGYIAGFLWFISAILFRKTLIIERRYKKFRK